VALWVFIGESSGMPLTVQKCDACPNLYPGHGNWIEVAPVDDAPTEPDAFTGQEELNYWQEEAILSRAKIEELETSLKSLQAMQAETFQYTAKLEKVVEIAKTIDHEQLYIVLTELDAM
jgi:hypothetical protein